MYGDVNVTVEDGNLGRSTSSTGTGVHVKVGASNIGSRTPILMKGTYSAKEIEALVGKTPLADACMDAIEGGAGTFYALPVAPKTQGTTGEVAEEKEGDGSVAVSGTPNNAYELTVEILDGGGLNEGSFQVSLDGGATFGDETTIPEGGTVELTGTGLTLTFSVAPEGTGFVSGDRFTVSTTAPVMNNQDVLDAVVSLRNFSQEFEFVHIVGASGKALWASLVTLADDYLTKYKRPLFFVCEARLPEAEESAKEYADAMAEERKGIASRYLQVVCAPVKFARMDGRTQVINLAGYLTGFYARARESQSIGEVRTFQISEAKVLALLPDGIEDYVEALDGEKFLTVRRYVGLENYYVTSANMMSQDGSDYLYAEDVRVSNRLVKAVRAQALQELQVEIDPGAVETSVAVIQENLMIPVEEAMDDGIISSGTVVIDTADLNILVDEALDVRITYVPMGHVRAINLTFAVENPYTSGEE